MKKGFTLIEALMVLSIIGVVATIMATTVANMKPDPELMRFRKAYMETKSVINELLSEEKDYKAYTPSFVENYSEISNWSKTSFGDRTIYEGSTNPSIKFGHYFSEKFIRYSPHYSTADRIEDVANRTVSFVTNDGIYFKITDGFATNNAGSRSKILIGVNGVSTGCQITTSTCTVPTLFELTIDPFGTITMASALNTYLQNPKITKFD